MLGQKAGFEATVVELRKKHAELATAYDALGPDREKRNKAVNVVVERRAALKGNLTHWNKSIDNAKQLLERNKLALEAHEKDLEVSPVVRTLSDADQVGLHQKGFCILPGALS